MEIICELSGCHGGSLENAMLIIGHAKMAGATGVKFQCFQPDRLAMRRASHPRIEKAKAAAGSGDKPLIDLYREIWTPWTWFPAMIDKATSLGLTWHSSVFDVDDVKFMETLDCPRYKISSFEANDAEIRSHCFLTGKQVIVSANQDERHFVEDYETILHATNYAVDAKNANLKILKQHARYRPGKFGLSDHTTSPMASQIAAAFGASMIEWHMRLPGVSTPDDAFSLLPLYFEQRVRKVREIEEAMRG
jgi:pseudaminic acid synthase